MTSTSVMCPALSELEEDEILAYTFTASYTRKSFLILSSFSPLIIELGILAVTQSLFDSSAPLLASSFPFKPSVDLFKTIEFKTTRKK